MKHLKSFQFLNEGNGPAFSIHDKKPGDTISVDGKIVKITKHISWVKDKNANCIEFEGEVNGKPVKIKYDDGCDGYVIL